MFYLDEFEDPKGVIRIRKLKDKQYSGQKKKYKRINNDLQNITHKTKKTSNTNPTKTGVELRCPGRLSRSCSNSGTHRVTLVTNQLKIHEWGKLTCSHRIKRNTQNNTRQVYKTSNTIPTNKMDASGFKRHLRYHREKLITYVLVFVKHAVFHRCRVALNNIQIPLFIVGLLSWQFVGRWDFFFVWLSTYNYWMTM